MLTDKRFTCCSKSHDLRLINRSSVSAVLFCFSEEEAEEEGGKPEKRQRTDAFDAPI
jgi:hypothetical protein